MVVMDGLAVTLLPVEELNEEAGDHTYVLAPEAPITVEPPIQIDASAVVITVGGDEEIIVKLEDVKKMFAFVTVTIKVPAARLLTEAEVCAGTRFHKYVYWPGPP